MNLTPIQVQKLTKHIWRVFTDDQITQQAIAEQLAKEGDNEGSTTSIFYDGREVPVFIVSFKIVLLLAKNRVKVPYDFTAYHKENQNNPWVMWKEGRTTPMRQIAKLDHLFRNKTEPTTKTLKRKAKEKKLRDKKLQPN